jgi:hypothetical protein
MDKKILIPFLLMAILTIAGASFVGTANANDNYPPLPSVINPILLEDGIYTIEGSQVILRHASPTELWIKTSPQTPMLIFSGSPTDTSAIPHIEFLDNPSDYNRNGMIDVVDLTMFMKSYGKYGVYNIHFDRDLNGVIDIADLAELMVIYGK